MPKSLTPKLAKLKQEKEVVGIYISGHPLDDFRIEMKHFCNATLADLQNLEHCVNRELTIGGVVSEVQHRTTKQGMGWASFIIEDYNESYEFRIFKEEYLKYRHFLVPNSFVQIKVFIKEGWVQKDTGKKGEPRLQFNNVQLLQEVMDIYAKKLTIQLDIAKLEEEHITELKDIFQSHPGDNNLNFVVYEMQEQVKLQGMTRQWWDTVSTMPHCVLWSPADWMFALTTATVADAAFCGISSAATELRNREKVLGTTVEYRRDLRIRYVDPVVKEKSAEVANIADYRDL